MQPCLSNSTISESSNLKQQYLRNPRFPVHSSPPRKFQIWAALARAYNGQVRATNESYVLKINIDVIIVVSIDYIDYRDLCHSKYTNSIGLNTIS